MSAPRSGIPYCHGQAVNALYAKTLRRYRAMRELPMPYQVSGGKDYAIRARAVRRVRLERRLEQVTAAART